MDRGRRTAVNKTNGHSAGTAGQHTGDIYKQLIDNDMVKELDDIEAISQQISQHAEVLYNSWKSNGMTQGPQFKLSAAQAMSPSLEHSMNPLSKDLRERGGRLSPRPENGPALPFRNSSSSSQHFNTYRSSSLTDNGKVITTTFSSSEDRSNGEPTQAGGPYAQNLFDRQNHHANQKPPSDASSSPRQSTISSPSSSTRESPARGSSITHITQSPLTTDVGPLELLASPNLNGSLEELVTSFVSTDRAKQAARNTISSTIMRRLGSPNGSSSPVRSPSPTSTLSYKGTSPLRSPMLTNAARSSASPDPLSQPRTPIANMFPGEPNFGPGGNANINRNPSPFSLNSDVHAPMTPMFSSPTTPLAAPRPAAKDEPDAVAIPVKHISLSVKASSSPSSSEGLKSPSVLQNANSRPAFPQPQPNLPEPSAVANMFDDFKDPDSSVNYMRKRFEEAKQRMALSLPAREGGVRPGSFTSMTRSLFEREGDRMGAPPWGDDASAFLLEQFR